jgi:catechol 2,3-dioxygenase-like lactoylglutathione lyase family enzyme
MGNNNAPKRPFVDIGIVCSHFDQSLRFYRDLLGLPVALDIQIPAEVAVGAGLAPRPFRQVRLKAGETLIKLMEIQDPPPRRPADFAAGVRWLTLFVDDAWKTYDDLRAKGVQFLAEPVVAPDAAGVVCALDPDGLLVEFVQLRPDFPPG